MTNLQRLNLRHNNVFSVPTSMLKMREKLVVFNLQDNPLEDEGLFAVAKKGARAIFEWMKERETS